MAEEIKEEVVEEQPEEKKKGLFGKVKSAILQMLKNKLLSLVHLFALPFLPGRVGS